MEEDELPDPGDIGFLGSDAVMQPPEGLAQPVQQPGFARGERSSALARIIRPHVHGRFSLIAGNSWRFLEIMSSVRDYTDAIRVATRIFVRPLVVRRLSFTLQHQEELRYASRHNSRPEVSSVSPDQCCSLEARQPVSSLALLPNLLDSFASAEAAAWLSPLQGDRDVWQSNRRVGSLGVNLTASGFEVYGDEAAVPMPRQWITSPTTDDDGVPAQGWSSTVAVPDALGAIASPSMPDFAAVALATGRGAAQPISGDTAALSVAAAIAGVMMATSAPSPPGVEQATDAEIRPMSLPPLVGTAGSDDPTLAALADSGGSGGGSSGGSGGSGGAELTISFTGGGAPVQVDGQYYDAIGNQVVVRVQGHNDMLTSVR